MTINITQLVTSYGQKLSPICSTLQDAQQEVWWFIEHATGKRKSELLVMHNDTHLAHLKEQLDSFIIQRTVFKKPLQYILGSVPFCDLTILVEPPILIPRPETEEWTLWLINQYKAFTTHPISILDLCTGSGCIGLQFAHTFPKATVVGVDINPQAIALAEKNKALNALSNITFLQGDLFEPLNTGQRFDLIVSNPPYLAPTEWDMLDQEVTRWEDKGALVAQQGGMEIYERIFANVKTFLIHNPQIPGNLPRIVMEIGPCQDQIEGLATRYGFEKSRFFVDTEGKRRWLALYV